MYNVAFAGFRHGHIYMLYDQCRNSGLVNIAGSFEEDDAARKDAADGRGVPRPRVVFAGLSEQLLEDRLQEELRGGEAALRSLLGRRGYV